jgi:hypothetical protein
MKSKVSGAAILTFFLCTAQPAVAQVSQFLNSTTETSSLPKTEPQAANSAILIRVIEANQAPIFEQAVVNLASARTHSSLYAATENNGRVTFNGLAPGRYTITVSAAGYRTTQRTADILSHNGHYESVVELHRDSSSIAVITHERSTDDTRKPADDDADNPAQSQSKVLAEAASWWPIDVDDEKLVTALDTPCPCQEVLESVSHRVEDFADNINRFAATEHLTSENLNSQGKILQTEHRKFDYVVNISKLQTGDLDVDEFRNGVDSYSEFPDQIASSSGLRT